MAEYWIVDIESRLVERWRPEDERPEVLHDAVRWLPIEGGRTLTIGLEEVWPEAL